MSDGETLRKLAEMTDAGLFERLAMAVLRESSPQYRLLTHPGVNQDGKTVKAPVDGIVFVPGAAPPHMIAVHHTTVARDDLEKKWLHDPGKATSAKGKKGTPGDLVKTAKALEEQKAQMPGLRATLILTTNKEPPATLVYAVKAAALRVGIEIEIWSGSVIAHFLDTDPTGQWFRRTFLRIEQERLSSDLLRDLSGRSLEFARPPDDEGMWVGRALDRELDELASQDVTFVVAESGSGKSVACYKRLKAHIEAGGYGLVLPHMVLAESVSLDQAIDAALRLLHPALGPGAGSAARALSSQCAPLLLVVEDINRSGQPAVLLERIASWSARSRDRAQGGAWSLLCPVWPRILAGLGDEARKHIDALTLKAKIFTSQEGAAAVQRRRERAGVPATRLEAESVSAAFGHDPLLIALHEPTGRSHPGDVIGRFVELSLGRLAANRDDYTPAEYRDALRQLAGGMLELRCLEPTMIEVGEWFGGTRDTVTMVRHVARFGEILRIAGSGSNEHIAFRHDRVRDWLLGDAAADLMRRGAMPEPLLADPYFAEIHAAAVLAQDVPAGNVEQLRLANPLALFCALHGFSTPANEIQRSVLAAAEDWLNDPATPGPQNKNLEWEAQRALAECESSFVAPLAQRFGNANGWWALRARFRNGDAMAGIQLCRRHEPGVRGGGHLELIEYVQQRQGASLLQALDALLRGSTLTRDGRIGALRLAGHLADATLAGAVESSWRTDSNRLQDLNEYLWACAECCGDDAGRLLDPVCDAWAALSDEPEGKGSSSPRNKLAAHNVRWAFHLSLPEPALHHFIQRAQTPELRWPITYMLHGVDHPAAVEFIAREAAALQARVEGTAHFSHFAATIKDIWTRRQDGGSGRAMSAASRARLYELWNGEEQENHLRKAAFRLWAATIASGDLAVLRPAAPSPLLADLVLWERLRRGDREAIPELIRKLRQKNRGYWWQTGRYIWSSELTDVLDGELARHGSEAKESPDTDPEEPDDWITSELVMRLPVQEAETLLLRHWECLRPSPRFIQAALYVATPRLTKAVAAAVSESADPKALFEHLSMHWGYKTLKHPGIVRLEQLEALLPYFGHLSDLDLQHFWEVCNEHGWFELRRQHLDRRLTLDRRSIAFTDDARAMAELDRLLAQKPPYWADMWADDFLKTGVSVRHVMDVLRSWLATKKDHAALELAANVVIHAGRREDLGVLSGHAVEPTERAAAVIANASFAVRRRSLN